MQTPQEKQNKTTKELTIFECIFVINSNNINIIKNIISIQRSLLNQFISEAAFYYFREQAKKYKGLFKLKIGSHKIVALYNPEDVEVR